MHKKACPNCKKNDSEFSPTLGVLPCLACQEKLSQFNLSKNPEFITISRKDRIESQREEYMADILQPYNADGSPNKDFVREYPDAIDEYFTSEDLQRSDI